ncbi:LysR family transcriptional regulator [Rhodopila sp.]|uniref:LysR family transcriptional regulator n=1 Tax=Rhodopila sp. TaxID=2480087 RepID=UPI002CDCB565|nr:LysR family transcriptional regulator [Rhodopila sp.]HVZ07940.1 LysR family transcriptional regulator [Rhodopila sp.]
MLDLWRLRCFVAVGELEHVGSAAERLHISPSPLSRQIRQLEEELGLELFDRVGKRLQLTTAGRDFLGRARRLLESAETVEREGKRLASPNAGPVAVGYIQEAILNGMIPRVVKRLGPNSGISLLINQMRTVEQLRALEASKIDIGILSSPPTERHFECRLLSREPYSAVFSSEHRLARVQRLKLEHLRDEVWVGPPLEVWQTLSDLLSSRGAASVTAHATFDIAASFAMVREGIGYTIVQSNMSNWDVAGLVFRQLPRSWLNLELHAVWRRDALNGAGRRVLEQFSRDSGVE